MRILLLSNFGPLFPAEYIYKYLVREHHNVVSVGRIVRTNMPEFQHTINRLGNTHMPLFWRGKTNDNGMPVWEVDLSVVFEMLGDEWDAVIECECYNLKISDRDDWLKVYKIPYFFYKTQYLEDYVPAHATHIFYAADLIKDKFLKGNPEEILTYLPLTVDPEIVKAKRKKKKETYAFFAGQYPEDDYLPEFKKVYKMRGEVIDYLEMNLDGKFICFKRRAFDYMEYVRRAAESTIMINAGIGGLNIRDFEAMALGKVLVSWDNPEYIKNHFDSGINFAHYNDKEGALDVVKYLLETPEEMKILGRNAKKVFNEFHHPKKRIEVIIEAIKNAIK